MGQLLGLLGRKQQEMKINLSLFTPKISLIPFMYSFEPGELTFQGFTTKTAKSFHLNQDNVVTPRYYNVESSHGPHLPWKRLKAPAIQAMW